MNYQIFNRSEYDFTARTVESTVLAYDSVIDTWVKTTMGVVKDYDRYTRFYFLDDIMGDVSEEEEVQEPTAAERARDGVNEMLGWINMWAVKMPAVDDKLNEFRDRIFEAIGEMEDEIDSW